MKKVVLAALAALLAWGNAATARDPEPVNKAFTWGADVGGSVDMEGHDMSTLDIDAYFGYRGPWLQIAGIGAGINMPVDNSYRTFPIYGIVRTSFARVPRPVFADIRVGCVINETPDGEASCNIYCSPGVGFRLAYGKTYASYLIVGYMYNGMRGKGYIDDRNQEIKGLSAAVIRLGIRF